MKRNFYLQTTILCILVIFATSCRSKKSTAESSVNNAPFKEKEAVFVPNLKIAKQGTVLKNKKKDAFKAKFGLVNIVLRNDTLFAKCTHGGGCGKTNFFLNEYLSNDKEEMISETLGLEYTGSGYMFGNCLTVLFQYKSSGGVVDRDLVPEDSIYLTFNFRNLGEYNWQPKEINKALSKSLRY